MLQVEPDRWYFHADRESPLLQSMSYKPACKVMYLAVCSWKETCMLVQRKGIQRLLATISASHAFLWSWPPINTAFARWVPLIGTLMWHVQIVDSGMQAWECLSGRICLPCVEWWTTLGDETGIKTVWHPREIYLRVEGRMLNALKLPEVKIWPSDFWLPRTKSCPMDGWTCALSQQVRQHRCCCGVQEVEGEV